MLVSFVFQSYLYGIEMIKNSYLFVITTSFNRTFMELKLTILFICRNKRRFQSYLYGIEIDLLKYFYLKRMTKKAKNSRFELLF